MSHDEWEETAGDKIMAASPFIEKNYRTAKLPCNFYKHKAYFIPFS